MHKSVFLTTAALIFIFVVATPATLAQEHDAPKVEVGAQFSSLSITPPNAFGTENATGFGGRVTYNLNDHVAVEAEDNFYPTSTSRTYVTGGTAEQMQFGLKVGKRFEKFGVFAKVRPGFISFGEAQRVTQLPVATGNIIDIVNVFTDERKTHFTTDVGGVLELYPSRRVLVRFDFGDTLIRYGEHDEAGPVFLGSPDTIFRVPAEIKHNFQFTGGVSYRFGGGAGGSDDAGAKTSSPSDTERRFEVGIQFSSFALNLSSNDIGFPFFAPFDTGNNTEAGFGARVGYNFNDNFALEAEGNFYPRRSGPNSSTGGYPTQMQFGPKFGKRFRRFGLFAKARPGFVSFSRVLHQTGTETFTFGSQTFIFPTFEDRRRTYFSADLGGVLEFYPSSRILTRFDFGDTLIHYGRRDARGIITTSPPATIPPSTRHNFQFTAGIGLRF